MGVGGSEAEIKLRLSSAKLLAGTGTELGNKAIVSIKYYLHGSLQMLQILMELFYSLEKINNLVTQDFN